MGRPKGAKNKYGVRYPVYNFRLPAAVQQKIKDVALAEGTTPTVVVRSAIYEGLKKRDINIDLLLIP